MWRGRKCEEHTWFRALRSSTQVSVWIIDLPKSLVEESELQNQTEHWVGTERIWGQWTGGQPSWKRKDSSQNCSHKVGRIILCRLYFRELTH